MPLAAIARAREQSTEASIAGEPTCESVNPRESLPLVLVGLRPIVYIIQTETPPHWRAYLPYLLSPILFSCLLLPPCTVSLKESSCLSYSDVYSMVVWRLARGCEVRPYITNITYEVAII